MSIPLNENKLNDNLNNEKEKNFDIKIYILILITYWPYFILSLLISFSVAFIINRYTNPVYELSSSLILKEDKNPFYSSNVGVMFKWGGVGDKVFTNIAILQSKSHNKKIIKKLNLECEIIEEGRIRKGIYYGTNSFKVEFDKFKFVPLNQIFELQKIDNKFKITFQKTSKFQIIQYNSNEIKNISFDLSILNGTYSFPKVFQFDDVYFKIDYNFKDDSESIDIKKVRFLDYNQLIAKYANLLTVDQYKKEVSILKLSMKGENVLLLKDYLNTSMDVFKDYQVNEKNEVSENTINFIDNQLKFIDDTLKSAAFSLQEFRKENKVVNLSSEAEKLYSQYFELSKNKTQLELQLKYFEYLENYLNKNKNFSTMVIPSTLGIQDPSLASLVAKITQLSSQLSMVDLTLQKENPIYINIEREIEITKNALVESSRSLQNAAKSQMNDILIKMREAEGQISNLPVTEQAFINFKRNYEIVEKQYTYLLQKRAETGMVKAANIADATILDYADQSAALSISPKKNANYLISFFIGILIPILFVLALDYFNNKLNSIADLESISTIPILSAIGHSDSDKNLVVSALNSPISESFRALRTNLNFVIEKKNPYLKSNIICITSSVSGEGKTFISINLASSFAISGKKTLLVGLDLRKPKIYQDFNLKNVHGMSTYLAGKSSSEEIIQFTDIDNLHIISAGPIPPNPSELIVRPSLKQLFEILREEYEYIVIDTPPLGIISDALELIKFSDLNLYVVRQNFSQRTMIRDFSKFRKEKDLQNVYFIYNDLSFKKNLSYYAYGYLYGYGYSYSYGYGYGYGKENT